jgi:hypothetical protein
MKTTVEIVNLVSKALELCPIKWVDINKDFVKFEYGGTIFRITKELSVEEAKESCLARTVAAIFLELLITKTDKYEN